MAVREEVEDLYRVLDLPTGSSSEEVHAAWRDLVKIWHPDRFTNDPRLQDRCQEKLKLINDAHERLTVFLSDPRYAELTNPVPYYRRCPQCGRPVQPEQPLCSECTLARQRRRPAKSKDRWLVPIALALLVQFAYSIAGRWSPDSPLTPYFALGAVLILAIYVRKLI